jgi:hypothetical protein
LRLVTTANIEHGCSGCTPDIFVWIVVGQAFQIRQSIESFWSEDA